MGLLQEKNKHSLSGEVYISLFLNLIRGFCEVAGDRQSVAYPLVSFLKIVTTAQLEKPSNGILVHVEWT